MTDPAPAFRIVLDTNTLVSRLLMPGGTAARAVDLAITRHRVLMSDATFTELARVLSRPKFDRYVTVEERQQFIRHLGSLVEMLPIVRRVQACRDPKDDALLELALNGEASHIVTGDADLLVLHPWQGVEILKPVDWLALSEASA
jgi:putative PIN family toxin of toxin-antitoxin system